MIGPQASMLSGDRLHLHHGPIDLIIGVEGAERDACFQFAKARFVGLLDALVGELPILRRPLADDKSVRGPVAQRMCRAVQAHRDVFVTPMAAVAGAVADEILAAMLRHHCPRKAYVNNGGDIAIHLLGDRSFQALGPSGKITITADQHVGGVATSGWRGRSHSRGIADAVTVLADCAASADVAATLIANAVDLPRHPGIQRSPASDLSPESDLGSRLVTTDVASLSPADVAKALASGSAVAQKLVDANLIHGATLLLQDQTQTISTLTTIPLVGTHAHA